MRALNPLTGEWDLVTGHWGLVGEEGRPPGAGPADEHIVVMGMPAPAGAWLCGMCGVPNPPADSICAHCLMARAPLATDGDR